LVLTFAWFLTAIGLWAALLGLEFYWNSFGWHPRIDLLAGGLLTATGAMLAMIWFLARVPEPRLARTVTLLLCLALAALAAYALPPEPSTPGAVPIESASPLWYRGGRFALMALPAVFKILGLARIRKRGG
jgi:hypothetical protein